MIRFETRAALVEGVSEERAFAPFRDQQIAAVSTARKLANLIWHILSKEEDYAWTRPALIQWKIRELELTLKAEMKSEKAELIKWMFGGFVSIASLVMAVLGVGVSILLKLH